MKIVVGVDLEGITGVVNREHTARDGRLYGEAIELMAGDINATMARLHGATCLPPERTRVLLKQSAIEAVGRIGKIKPLDLGSPAVVELSFKHTEHADATDLRGFDGRRIDGYTVQWTGGDFPSWYGFSTDNPPPR